MTDALNLVRVGGTVSVVGVHTLNPFAFPATISLIRSITLPMTTAPVQRTWPEVVPLLQSGRLDVSGIFADAMPLADASTAYAAVATIDRWRDGYDWRATEAELNEWGSFLTTAAGQWVHLLHVRSDAADAIPLVLVHGCRGPSSNFSTCCHCWANSSTWLLAPCPARFLVSILVDALYLGGVVLAVACPSREAPRVARRIRELRVVSRRRRAVRGHEVTLAAGFGTLVRRWLALLRRRLWR